MRHQFLQRWNLNLDLAVEAHDLLRGATHQEIPGVKEEKKYYQHCQITTITILNAEGAKFMGRPPGMYITIEAPGLREVDKSVHQALANAVAEQLAILVKNANLMTEDPVLVVGLGNWQATPDALGPRVIEFTLVTRHFHVYAPEYAVGLRPVSALAPGVLGNTGMETAEIIKGVIDRLKPKLLIAIDALAASSVNRIASTIQMADTGINPGSGLGNNRMGLNQESLGVPVIAIGIPTVVRGAVIAFDVLEKFAQRQKAQLSDEAVDKTVEEILSPFGGNLTVTPKEIDELIANNARILAAGLNVALHPAVPRQDLVRDIFC